MYVDILGLKINVLGQKGGEHGAAIKGRKEEKYVCSFIDHMVVRFT